MRNIRRVGAGFYLLLIGAVLLTALIHEGAHWLAGTALGHQMTFNLNSVGPMSPVSMRDHLIISAAGPLVTILQGLIAFVLVLRRDMLGAYAFLFFAALMRVTATAVSVFNPNDEARISLELGMGQWTLPLIVCGLLIALTVVASRKLRIGWKTNLLTYLVCTVGITAIVGLDMLLKA
jgi:hypothetical protein